MVVKFSFNLLICCFAILFLSIDAFKVYTSEESKFYVRPSGQTETMKKEWEEAKLSCTFTYKAMGGTHEGKDEIPLQEDEYIVDEATNSISQVDGKFKNQMDKIILYGERPKSEL